MATLSSLKSISVGRVRHRLHAPVKNVMEGWGIAPTSSCWPLANVILYKPSQYHIRNAIFCKLMTQTQTRVADAPFWLFLNCGNEINWMHKQVQTCMKYKISVVLAQMGFRACSPLRLMHGIKGRLPSRPKHRSMKLKGNQFMYVLLPIVFSLLYHQTLFTCC